MHHRHLRPWELFADTDDEAVSFELKKGSFDSLGSANSYEDEPWVATRSLKSLKTMQKSPLLTPYNRILL